MTLLVLIVAGLAGLFTHWAKRWARGQTDANFMDYMLSHKKYTAASVLTLIGGIVGMFAAGDVAISQASLALAYMAGFNIDSMLNKSPEEE